MINFSLSRQGKSMGEFLSGKNVIFSRTNEGLKSEVFLWVRNCY